MKGHSSGSYNKEVQFCHSCHTHTTYTFMLQADLYSYGILLFNLITNHKPFDYLPDARDQDKAVKEVSPTLIIAGHWLVLLYRTNL